ncbi:MAG: HEAT repeat domain-containing protein [bacterium]
MDPEARENLITQVESSDEEVRRSSMLALKQELSESDLKWLTKPLSDGSWRVRKEAIEGTSRMSPTAPLVRRLVGMMDPSHEVTLRNSVVEILERMGSRVTSLILEHLSVDQPDTRKFLVDILGNIADPQAVNDLIRLLNDPNNNIRAAAAEALASIGDKSSTEALLKTLDNADEWTAYSVLGALASIPAREALPKFFKYLDHRILASPSIAGIGATGDLADGVRLMKVIGSLSKGGVKGAFLAAGDIYIRSLLAGEMESTQELKDAVSAAVDEDVVEFLTEQLSISDKPDEMRKIIAVLGILGGPECMDAVLRLIDDDTVEWDVTMALVGIAKTDQESVVALLSDDDELIRRRALEVLERLGGEISTEKIYPLLLDQSGHVRKQAARTISVMGDIASLDPLLSLLEDEYDDVAQGTAEAIALIGGKDPGALAQKIEPLLSAAVPMTRALVIRILGEVDAKRHEALFLNALQDEEPLIRASGINSLKKIGESDVSSAIINSLADEDSMVRVEAALALEELKVPEAAAPLMAALNDHDPWVRTVAVSALASQPEVDVQDLADLLDTDDRIIKSSVIEALGKRGAEGREDVIDILRETFRGETVEIKCNICRVIGQIEGARSLDFLTVAAQDEDSSVRTFAAQALASFDEDAARRLLLNISENDPDRKVREAVRSIISSGSRDAV